MDAHKKILYALKMVNMMESELKCGDYSFRFNSLKEFFIDVKECKKMIHSEKKSLIKECVIFIITKNNLSRIKKTLPQLYHTP